MGLLLPSRRRFSLLQEKGAHYTNTEIRAVVIGAVTASITSGLVAVADYTVRNRESDIKMMELAVGLLKEDAKGASTACARVGGERYQLLLEGQRSPLDDKASLALGGNSIAIRRAVAAEAAEAIHGLAETLGAPGTKLVPFDGGYRIVPAPE